MGEEGDWGANFSGTSMAAYEDTLVGPMFVPWGEHLPDRVKAGFADVEVSRNEITVVFEDAGHLIRTLGAAPVGAKVQALGPDGRRTLRRAVEKAASTLIDLGAISGMTTCHTATGAA